MRNILLLTYFSNNSQNAINYALKFFKGEVCHFFILHVYKISSYTTGNLMSSEAYSSVYDSIVKNPKMALSAMAEEYGKTFIDEAYSFDTICDFDTFLSAIQQAIKMNDIALIVMGTNGATGAKEVIFGSNTLSVIRNIDCQVLAVPQDYKYIELTNVLYVTRSLENFVKDRLESLVHIIDKYNATLHILSIENDTMLTRDIKKKERMLLFVKKAKAIFHSIVNVPADQAIDSFVQLNKVDFIAIIIHKESFFKRLLSDSSTSQIMYKSRVPLFIMHP